MKLGVIDYGAGNLRSVLNTFEAAGVTGHLVRTPEDAAGVPGGEQRRPGQAGQGDLLGQVGFNVVLHPLDGQNRFLHALHLL